MLTLVYLCAALCVLQTSYAESELQSKHCSKNYHFDYILLATQWPEAFCETSKCAPHKDKWSIHGAWPENNNGSYPQNCCTEHHFDAKILKPIESDLIAHWKTLQAHGTNENFWSHEYEKHGTCAIESPLLKDELSYFQNTLNAFKKLNIDQWLSDAGLALSDTKTYKLEDFRNAVKKGLGHEIMLQCVKTKHHNHPVISQINFCLDKNTLKPFDCHYKQSSCSDEIYYPPSK